MAHNNDIVACQQNKMTPCVHYITAKPCQTDLIGAGRDGESGTKPWIHNFQTGSGARYRATTTVSVKIFILFIQSVLTHPEICIT